ncbi:MAG: DUF3298 domain-containing protein [Bacteroidaceae bacterium]|nr:DUF3298 domain-containing protein [Bacteroidaceae bacterium]
MTNTKRMKKFLSFPLVALACACVGGGTAGTEQAHFEWGIAKLCIENPIAPDAKECYHIELNLDTLGGDGALAAELSAVLRDSVLYAPVRATVIETMAAFADSLETEWKTELAEWYDPDAEYKDMYQYYYKVDGRPTEQASDSILSYISTTDCYLGGAHGSYVIHYYNFDRKGGKLIDIKDVVPADKKAQVLKAMEQQLCKDWGALNLADLQQKTGITMLGDLYLTNNFLLKGDSIEFLFNQYEIAPYAAGLIGITIPLPANQ